MVDLLASPLHRLDLPALTRAGVQLFLKRDDLIDPHFGGNKWRKLKYNLRKAREMNARALLTFGGAYSNHIHAVAAAGQKFGMQTIGVIRGEAASASNTTLTFAQACGMHLHFVDRAHYQKKTDSAWLLQLEDEFGPFYHLPEGGSNGLALPGCAEIVGELDLQLPSGYDVLAVPLGSGGTLAGLVSGMVGRASQVQGYAVLKGEADLAQRVTQLLAGAGVGNAASWRIDSRYHFGGYARCDAELFGFLNEFRQTTGVQLDPIYNGKMLYGLLENIRRGEFARGTRIVALHTGGLQGWVGIARKYKLNEGSYQL